MSFSVNTNTGAMTALQYLQQTQGQLNQTQSAINSGLKVATANLRHCPEPARRSGRLLLCH
jgi:hypothetical protein